MAIAVIISFSVAPEFLSAMANSLQILSKMCPLLMGSLVLWSQRQRASHRLTNPFFGMFLNRGQNHSSLSQVPNWRLVRAGDRQLF
jgi:hypothetical protein